MFFFVFMSTLFPLKLGIISRALLFSMRKRKRNRVSLWFFFCWLIGKNKSKTKNKRMKMCSKHLVQSTTHKICSCFPSLVYSFFSVCCMSFCELAAVIFHVHFVFGVRSGSIGLCSFACGSLIYGEYLMSLDNTHYLCSRSDELFTFDGFNTDLYIYVMLLRFKSLFFFLFILVDTYQFYQ